MKASPDFVNSLRYRAYSSTIYDNPHFETDCKDSLVPRLSLDRKLEVHNGCVNTISWDITGKYLLSGSDDLHLVISDPFAARSAEVVAKWRTPHRSNIFCADFFADSNCRRVISASCDGLVCVSDLEAPESERFTQFECHGGTVYEVRALREEASLFLTCSEDGTLRQYDLRERSKCTCSAQHDGNRLFLSHRRTRCNENVTIDCGKAITAFAVSPARGYLLALAVADGSVRLYDRRFLSMASDTSKALHGLVGRFAPPCTSGSRSNRITCVQFAPDGRQLLASYYGANLYLISVSESCSADDAVCILDSLRSQSSSASADKVASTRRIRLRGDWSDTGPSARPEADRTEARDVPEVTPDARDRMMDRFSDLLTRFFEARMRNSSTTESQQETQNQESQVQSVASNSEVSAQGVTRDARPQVDSSSESEEDGEEDEICYDSQSLSQSQVRREELRKCVGAFKERKMRDGAFLARLGMLKPLRWYSGHRNSRTMIKKATFWGDRHVLSGSDCGHVFIWDRHTAAIVGVLEADRHVVNCLQPHPRFPYLATSGIDYDVKLWSPLSEQPSLSTEAVKALTERNARMLQETADTLTMPPALVIRMLAAMRDSRLRAFAAARRDGDNSAAARNEHDDNNEDH